MKILFKISQIGLFYLLSFTCCAQDEEIVLSFETVRIYRIINSSVENFDTISFEYNNNESIIKGVHSSGTYFTNEYDDSNRLIQLNSYNSNGLNLYFTFQYNSNSITTMRFLYYPDSDTWGGDDEKSVYFYNLQNNCERIDYYFKKDNGDWAKSEYYSICTWINDNLTEYKHYKGDNLEYTETYQYDDKLNPEKLLNHMISPWTKSKNNMINSSKQYQDGRQTFATYEYSYNEFIYPTKKIRIDEIGINTKEYEYKFE